MAVIKSLFTLCEISIVENEIKYDSVPKELIPRLRLMSNLDEMKKCVEHVSVCGFSGRRIPSRSESVKFKKSVLVFVGFSDTIAETTLIGFYAAKRKFITYMCYEADKKFPFSLFDYVDDKFAFIYHHYNCAGSSKRPTLLKNMHTLFKESIRLLKEL